MYTNLLQIIKNLKTQSLTNFYIGHITPYHNGISMEVYKHEEGCIDIKVTYTAFMARWQAIQHTTSTHYQKL